MRSTRPAIFLAASLASGCIADHGPLSDPAEPPEVAGAPGVVARPPAPEAIAPGPAAARESSAIAAGETLACALDDDRRLWCWGRGHRDVSVGDGVPTVVLDEVTDVAVGARFGCALRTDGSTWCWGQRHLRGGEWAYQPPTRVGGLGRAVRLDVHLKRACVLDAGGRVTCWSHGGDPATTHAVPGAVDVATGYAHDCAADSDGSVWCWGDPTWGGLGDAGADPVVTPRRIAGVEDVVAVGAGQFHTCALHGSGRVSCWGWNVNGQLGTPDDVGWMDEIVAFDPRFVPDVEDAIELDVGPQGACVVTGAGEVRCWGVVAWRDDSASGPTTVAGLAGVSRVAAGDGFACARDADAVSCWGRNADGQLGSGRAGSKAAPSRVDLEDVVQIDAARDHTCALTGDGSVWCWGANGLGEVGDGTRAPRDRPTRVAGLPVAIRVATGEFNACALSRPGEVYCWGRDLTDPGAGRLAPQLLEGVAGAEELQVGVVHACIRRWRGDVWCWGQDVRGRVGHDDSGVKPVHGLPRMNELVVGPDFSCARNDVGSLWCWGEIPRGVPEVDAERAVRMETLPQVSAFGLRDNLCVVDYDGVVQCHGWNGMCQLGPTDALWGRGVVEGARGAEKLELGLGHACARMPGGAVQCWGNNHTGQLGRGVTGRSDCASAAVMGLSNVVEIAAGSAHTCALDDEGHAWCWGDGAFGQLGDGDAWRSAPVAVRGLPD